MPYYFVKKWIMFNAFSSSKRFSDLKIENNRKYIYIYILFSHKKRNTGIFDNMDGL